MNQETALAAACGLYCGDCEYLEKQCAGCGNIHGKPFWAGQYGVAVCPLYGCCVIQKGLEHCGRCAGLPCDILKEAFDHPEHGDRGERLANLKAWARGEDTYIELGTFDSQDEE